jgi:hypothetical protein
VSALLRGWILAASARALAPSRFGETPRGAAAFEPLRGVRDAAKPGWVSDARSRDRGPSDAAAVDFARPGFATVRAEVPPSPAGHAELWIHDGGGLLAALRELPPGHQGLRPRLPRFPAASQALGVTQGSATGVNLEMGVDRAAEDADAAD